MSRIRLQRKAGDMVLWLSTTPHQSDPPHPNAPHDAAAIFVCMAPRKFATKRVLASRIAAFESGRTSTHWPVLGWKMFPRHPRLYNGELIAEFKANLKRLPPGVTDASKLTPLGRRLVGYEK
jgi:hypothetical protein